MTEQRKKIKAVDAKAEKSLSEAIEDVGRTIDKESKGENFPSMERIEELWDRLDAETQTTYIEMFSGMISSLDEKELISSKKENSKGRG